MVAVNLGYRGGTFTIGSKEAARVAAGHCVNGGNFCPSKKHFSFDFALATGRENPVKRTASSQIGQRVSLFYNVLKSSASCEKVFESFFPVPFRET